MPAFAAKYGARRAEFRLLRCCSRPRRRGLALLAQLRQGCAVRALSAQHIYVVEFRELFGREGFGWAEDHVVGVVDDDVEAALSAMILDAGIGGFV